MAKRQPYPFKIMKVRVTVRDAITEETIADYSTNLADEKQRRTFAEQMTEAYAAGQYSIVEPIHSERLNQENSGG